MARDEAVRCYLTVCFEEHFWIGLYERFCGGRYEVCRIVFGAEPSSAEVYDFLLRNVYRLAFSPAVEAEMSGPRAVNPKRMQREARRQMQSAALGTRAQQALKVQQEQAQDTRKARRQERRETDEQRRYELRQEKKREKHRGH